MHSRSSALPILFAALVAGCYTYRPVSQPSPDGQTVRVTLTDAGAVSLASQLGPATENVSGRILGDSADAYIVSVLGTQRRGGVETDWRGEQVALPRPLIAHMEQRRFSRRRTTLAAVGVLAAAVAARQAFWGPGGMFGGAPPGGSQGPR